MNKSMRLMMLILCATGAVVMQGRAGEAAKGLETPLLKKGEVAEMGSPVSGDETKSDFTVVDISALAKATDMSESSSSSNSSTKSSPAKSEDGLLDGEKDQGYGITLRNRICADCYKLKNAFLKFIASDKSLNEKQKEGIGYIAVVVTSVLSEGYYIYVNEAYAFPLALFIGQCAAIVAKNRSYLKKLAGGISVGLGVSLLEKFWLHGQFGLYIPVSAAGFIFYSTVLDLMKKHDQEPIDIESGFLRDGTKDEI